MKSLHKTAEKGNNSKIFLGKVYSNFAAPVAFAELGLSLHSARRVPARAPAALQRRGQESPGWDAGWAGCWQGLRRPRQGEAGILTSTQPAW